MFLPLMKKKSHGGHRGQIPTGLAPSPLSLLSFLLKRQKNKKAENVSNIYHNQFVMLDKKKEQKLHCIFNYISLDKVNPIILTKLIFFLLFI